MRGNVGQRGSLSNMSPCPGMLGAVGHGDTEDIAKGGDAGLQVQLGRLGEIGFLAKVVQREECGPSLYLRLYQSGRGYLVRGGGIKGS